MDAWRKPRTPTEGNIPDFFHWRPRKSTEPCSFPYLPLQYRYRITQVGDDPSLKRFLVRLPEANPATGFAAETDTRIEKRRDAFPFPVICFIPSKQPNEERVIDLVQQEALVVVHHQGQFLFGLIIAPIIRDDAEPSTC